MSTAILSTACLFLVMFFAVEARYLRADENTLCDSKPPNGSWAFEHYTALTPEDTTLQRHARSVLYLTEVEEDFYIGDGSGVYFLSEIQDLYNGTQWQYHIAGFFDPETCMLSGVVFNLNSEPVFPDTIEYFYNGEMLNGIFVGSIEAPDSPIRVLTNLRGHHNGTYLGFD